MRSIHDSFHHSTSSSHYTSPASGSERAEFHDRYQNRVSRIERRSFLLNFVVFISVRMARKKSRHRSRFDLQIIRQTSRS